MTIPAFTMGPWRVEQRPSKGYGASNAPYEVWAAGSQSMTLALLNGRESPEIAANARLIAAAPDMYAAVQKVINNWGDLHSKDLHQLRAALAKAEGRS